MKTQSVIGFVGLGNMGQGMVQNLLKKGYSVHGFDNDASKLESFTDSSFIKAEDINDIAKSCELVVLCLPSPDASRDVIFNTLVSEMSITTTIIETSTLTPELVSEFSTALSGRGIEFLSAPMIGGKTHAANGTTKFLVEGSRENYDKYLEIFQAMGSQAAYVGMTPSATLAKIAFNISRYANLAVGVETYRLLKKYDANMPAIYEFMCEESKDNFGQVWAEDLEQMMKLDIPFKPSKVPVKDLTLFADMAIQNELNNGLLEAIRSTYISMDDTTNEELQK